MCHVVGFADEMEGGGGKSLGETPSFNPRVSNCHGGFRTWEATAIGGASPRVHTVVMAATAAAETSLRVVVCNYLVMLAESDLIWGVGAIVGGLHIILWLGTAWTANVILVRFDGWGKKWGRGFGTT